MKKVELFKWDLIITPYRSWFHLSLKEIWNYRDLLKIYIRKNIVTQYKQTLLGPLWILIPPIITTLTYTIIFGRIAEISTDGLPKPLFYLSGIVTWNYFSTILLSTSSSLTANAAIYGKVYFPRIIIPFATIISSLVKYLVQLFLFLILLVYSIYSYPDSIFIQYKLLVFVPLLVLIMAIQGLGLGLIISSLTSKYRDLRFVVSYGVQLLMYISPVIFPLSMVEHDYKWIILLNPMTSIIEFFRHIVFGIDTISFNYIFYSMCFSFIVLISGMILFNRIEKDFIDNV